MDTSARGSRRVASITVRWKLPIIITECLEWARYCIRGDEHGEEGQFIAELEEAEVWCSELSGWMAGEDEFTCCWTMSCCLGLGVDEFLTAGVGAGIDGDFLAKGLLPFQKILG